jgi:O-antigen/teichoic acid export membrane protein
MQKNSNFSQVLWLVLSNFSSFLLSFVSAAILSRYFDKVEYGTYKQIIYVYATLLSLFTLGLPTTFSYFIPRINAGQQKCFIQILNRLLVGLGLLFSVALFVLSDPIAVWLNNPELATGLKIFSPFPLFTLPTIGVEGIYTALRRTKEILVYQFSSKLFMLICIVLPVVLYGSNYRIAIVGWGIANFLTFLVAMWMKNRPYVHISKEEFAEPYKQIFNYSFPLLLALLGGVILRSADQFFISRYFGTKIFAEYSNGALSFPIASMISSSVTSVLLPIISKADSRGEFQAILPTYNNAVNKSVVLVYPMLVFCFFFSKDIMTFIYGTQYAASSLFFKCYLLRDFMGVLPYYSVMLALAMSKQYMYIHYVCAAVIWLADIVAVAVGASAYAIVLIASGVNILLSVLAFIQIYRKSGIHMISGSLFGNMVRVLIHVSICGLVLSTISSQIDGLPIVKLVGCGLLYYILIILSGRLIHVDYLESLSRLIKR